MLKRLVAITPLLGAILFPIVVPIIILQQGISFGLATTLTLTTLWFIFMLRTSEMPH